jgi:cephalosporin hydroxylase
LKAEFTDAFWRSGEWHGTSWLGRWAHRPPTDLFAYQELIFKVRPDWIIETRTGTGGRALFLASICDLLGSGEVISIDGYPPHDPPEHPRITYLRGDPAIAGTAERVKEVTGEQPRAMVVLGAGARTQLLDAIHNFATFVPIGSYLVVEDTILDGHLVWPEFGDGPRAAVNVTIDRGEFVPDPMFARYGVTFNARGFLKRVR